jgi:hypothetical protein
MWVNYLFTDFIVDVCSAASILAMILTPWRNELPLSSDWNLVARMTCVGYAKVMKCLLIISLLS